MGKRRRLILAPVLAAVLLTSTAVAAPGGPKAGRKADAPPSLAAVQTEYASVSTASPAVSSATGSDLTQLAGLSADELWKQFAQAEAHKKLYEVQEKAIREKLKLLEGPGAAFLYSSANGDFSELYTQLLDL